MGELLKLSGIQPPQVENVTNHNVFSWACSGLNEFKYRKPFEQRPEYGKHSVRVSDAHGGSVDEGAETPES